MTDLIGSAMWSQYKAVINSGHETFNQQSIVWLKSNGGLDRNGEDNLTENFSAVSLKGLIDYNSFRKWATVQTTETGELDRQTEVLLLNVKYLRDNNLLTASGNFNYTASTDRFIHNGIKYKSTGDTLISQAPDEPLLFQIILQREEIVTGDEMGNLPLPTDTGVQYPPVKPNQVFPFVGVTTVICIHNLGRYVDVTIYDTGANEIEGHVFQDPNNLNQVVITFNTAQSGVVVID